MRVLATVATDLQQLGNALAGDIIGWGTAVIGIALTASAVIWVFRLLRAYACRWRSWPLVIQPRGVRPRASLDRQN